MTATYTDSQIAQMREHGRYLGRAHRMNPTSKVYQWLDGRDPPRTLAWLAGELGCSRQTLQNYIRGERKVRGRIIGVPVPPDIKERVAAITAGFVTHEDWIG